MKPCDGCDEQECQRAATAAWLWPPVSAWQHLIGMASGTLKQRVPPTSSDDRLHALMCDVCSGFEMLKHALQPRSSGLSRLALADLALDALLAGWAGQATVVAGGRSLSDTLL